MATKKKTTPVTEETMEVTTPVVEEVTPEPVKEKTAVVTNCGKLNFRLEASKESNILGVLEAGTKLTIVDSLGEWTKVKVGKKTGFVMSQFIK